MDTMSDTTRKDITLTIDGVQVTVPEGTLIVDAARKANVDIPVFCYHPKMEPVGMCRVCLVEIGRPVVDRETGDVVLEDDGSPKLQFGWKLETACTTPVSDGMVVLGNTENASAGRKGILEFILTSHPLDCPICDKGGECPLQNLTMEYGPGESRFIYDDKIHFDKHVPLGELIFLDRERCILCARCVRFQDEIADDQVIGFFNRGRSLEIITCSDPGFDSYFSGNTTDICPVGALTTADFHFKARPWEMGAAASICNQCAVGCNLTLNVRREAKSDGRNVVKRVMPRQNEWVNETWICDKGRFGYHYAQHPERLTRPLIRRDGEMLEASWDDAMDMVAERFKEAGDGLLTLAGGRLSNEDLYNLSELTGALNGRKVLFSNMGGGDLVAQIGMAPGSNFKDMGPETAILVVACDLEEEAPIWWLRVKQAAERGAKLIVLNPRTTKLDRAATISLRYPYGSEAASVLAIVNALSAKRADLPKDAQQLTRSAEVSAAAKIFAEAENGVVIYGADGAGLEISTALAQACANLLLVTGHVGEPNNGLLGVWGRANEQGAWDMGFRPVENLAAQMQEARALYVVAADPAGDDPDYLIDTQSFLVVQDLFLTPTAKLADVVLPVHSWLERQGTYTSGERRVQLFYPAIPGPAGLKTDFAVSACIGKRLGIDIEESVPGRIFERIADQVSGYAGISYTGLAEVKEQWPIIGRKDLYYGGTTYKNSQGLGVQLPAAAQDQTDLPLSWPELNAVDIPKIGLLAVPITRLYDQGTTLLPSELLHSRIREPFVMLNPVDAERMRIPADAQVRVILGDNPAAFASVLLKSSVPERVALIPRSFGLPIDGPTAVEIKLAR
jgi:NADH-quinone oxidoreductase subunit G